MLKFAPEDVCVCGKNLTTNNVTHVIQMETSPHTSSGSVQAFCHHFICSVKSFIFRLENAVSHPLAANYLIEMLYYGIKENGW